MNKERLDVKSQLSENKREFWNVMKSYKDNGDTTTQFNYLVARINGMHYTIGPESLPEKGFEGRKFEIEFIDGPHKGKKITTTNLWFQGKIPKEFKKELTNNAKFIVDILDTPNVKQLKNKNSNLQVSCKNCSNRTKMKICENCNNKKHFKQK